MTNLELAKQQGNQCGPNLIDAQKAGEINMNVSVTELEQQGNRIPELVVERNEDADTENMLEAKEQYSQSGPNLLEAAEAGEFTVDDYLNFMMPNGGTISLNKIGSPTVVELEYSIDAGATWTMWPEDGGNRSLTLTARRRMYVRNTSETQMGFSTSESDYYQFTFTDTVEAHGNTNSLLCKNAEIVTSVSSFCYRFLFLNCTTITRAPELPATALADGCYRGMFKDCTSLLTVPELPATVLANACYKEMFQNCASLVTAPELPATALADNCYRRMFRDCSSVNKIHTLMVDISATNCLSEWLSGVSPTGDFYCDQNLTIPTGASGIPAGWTRHDL